METRGRAWHFLTGPEADVQAVVDEFGVSAVPDDGLMDHTLHTIDGFGHQERPRIERKTPGR